MGEILWSVYRDGGRFYAVPPGERRSGDLVCYTAQGEEQAKRLAKVFAEDYRYGRRTVRPDEKACWSREREANA